jgi:cytoskeletal protein CcmA (bactofilin family)
MNRTLFNRLADQAGYAMPTVIVVSALLMLVGALAIASGFNATTSSNRDRQVKVSRQAADSGLELALFHLNAVMAGQSLPCATRDAAGNITMTGYDASGQWCPPVTDTLADGAMVDYRISKETPIAGTNPQEVIRKVVATGTYVGQKRRVYTEIRAFRGIAGFFISGIQARDQITAINDAVINGNVRTNGNIRMENHASICGSVTYGPGKSLSDSSDQRYCNEASRGPATSQLVFDDYAADHAAAWTTNNNSRLGCVGANKDACYDPNKPNDPTQNILWDPSKRELIVQNDAQLTLSGDVYSLCRLNLKNNSRLFIALRTPPDKPLKIYFGSPSQCGGQTEPIMIENGWGITNNNTSPTSLQFFVRGSSSTTTKVNIKNNTANPAALPIMIYAPNSEVLLENNAVFNGGLVGKTVELKNNVQFTFDPNSLGSSGSTALVYQPMQHRECSPQPSGAPDSGC